MNEPLDASGGVLIEGRRLKRISERVHARLEAETVLALPSIHYTLCETGPAAIRHDPREITRALGLLANERESDSSYLPQGPWEPMPGIFVTPAITKEHAQHNAAIAAATREDQLCAWAAANRGNRAIALAETVVKSVSLAADIIPVDVGCAERLGGGATWGAEGARLTIGRGRGDGAACVWITSDLMWLFPDDPRLWRHLAYCSEHGERAVVVARKIAVSTYPVLKALGAFGLQLHHVYVADAHTVLPLGQRAFPGGPRFVDVREASNHTAIRERLPPVLADEPPHDDRRVNAIRASGEVGLQDEQTARPAALQEWVARTAFPMPAKWQAQLDRYNAWINNGSTHPRCGRSPPLDRRSRPPG